MVLLLAVYCLANPAEPESEWTIKVPAQTSVAHAVRRFLKKGEVVAKVVRAGPSLWAVFSGKVEKESDYLQTASVNLLEVGKTARPRLIGRERLVGMAEDSVLFLDAEMGPMTGRHTSNLTVTLSGPGGSVEPVDFYVFRADRHRLVKLGHACGEEGADVRDLNHDGKVELLVTDTIADLGLSHTAMPRWTEVYEYRQGRYRLATVRFPSVIRKEAAYIKECLKDAPNSPELLMYHGIAEAAFHRRKSARKSLIKGIKLMRAAYSNYKPEELRNLEQLKRGQLALRELG